MSRFLHTVPVQTQTISADGIFTFDMPVNPLSFLLLVARPLNDTGTLANFCNYLTLMEAFNRVSVYSRGVSVVSMRGEDIAAMNYLRHGIIPMQATHANTNNDRRAAVLPILLGRWPYSPTSCLPNHRRGECVLELDIDIADTGYDTLQISVESVELPEAKPAEYERKVQIAQTFAATGPNILDLSPGHLCRGIVLFGTTAFTGANPAPSWGRVKTLIDNEEANFQATDWEVLMTLGQLWGRQLPMADAHKHIITTDGNAQTELATLDGPYAQASGWQKYGYLDFDPTGDDTYALDARKASRFHIFADAEAADAVRAIPIDVINV